MKVKIFLLTALSLMAYSLCYSSPEGLEMKGRAAFKASDGELMVALVLVNGREERITVLTEPDSKAIARGGDGVLIVQASFGGTTKMFGHELIPSLSPYNAVSLDPGEATGVRFKMSPNAVEIEEGEEILIQYSIGDSLSEKYDLWSSTLKVRTQLLVM
jgi:hypothetical protein